MPSSSTLVYYSIDVVCVTGAGGTCVIRGCVPKKLLVYGAMFNDEFSDAKGFGWADVQPPHDWKSKQYH